MSNYYAGVGTAGESVALMADADIYKVFSKEILRAAMPVLRFKQLANVRTELGAQSGHTIVFHKIANLAFDTSHMLTEGTDMTIASSLSTTAVSIVVAERGKAVGVTEFMLRTNPLDTLGEASNLLGRHYAQVVDDEIRETLDPVGLSGGLSNYRYANGRSNTASLVSGDDFDSVLVKNMVEDLAAANVPLVGGDSYICFAHPHQLRHLRDDAAWINAANYGAPQQLFYGEVGRFENVRFIETTQCPIVEKTSGDQLVSGVDTGRNYTGNNLHASLDAYHAIMVGENAFGFAEALPVELRDNGVLDFGRKHGLAWYSIYGVGVLNATYGVVGISL